MKLKIGRHLAAQGLIEYALIVVLIAIATLAVLQISGVSIYNVYCRVASIFSSTACQTSTVYCNDGFNSLSGWQVTAGASNQWTVSNGQLCASGYGILTNKCSMSSSLPTADYVAQIDGAKLNSGNGYGIFFRSTNGSQGINGYAFQYDPGFNGLVIRKWVNNAEINPPIAFKSMPGADWYGTTHTLSVKVSEDTFTGMVDGVPVLTATDSTYPSGGTALRIWDSTQVCMDNFSVNSIVP